MDLAKVRGCLAVSILPLLLLVDPTAACYCLDSPPISLQTAYCTSDIVIGGKFVDSRFAGENDMTWAIYEFKVTQVFKGSIIVGEKLNLYTQMLGTTCGYRHNDPFSEAEYVVTGMFHTDHIQISVCSIIKQMARITNYELDGLEWRYSSECN